LRSWEHKGNLPFFAHSLKKSQLEQQLKRQKKTTRDLDISLAKFRVKATKQAMESPFKVIRNVEQRSGIG
jgi:hypothetical protein